MIKASKAFVGRLERLVVLGPDGESIGRVHDVVVTLRTGSLPPRVLGFVVQLLTRRRIFVPMGRIASLQVDSVTLGTGNVNTRRFERRLGETQVYAEIVDSTIRVNDPEVPELQDVDATIADVEIERTATRDWYVSRVAVRRARTSRLARRGPLHVVPIASVTGLQAQEFNSTRHAAHELVVRFEEMRPADVAHELRDLPTKRRQEVAAALHDEHLADIVQELSHDDGAAFLAHLDPERAADVLNEMDPDDAADLLGSLPDAEAEELLGRMDPEDSAPVRRLLSFPPDTAGGLMTPEPIILTPQTTVAEALAHCRDPELTPAVASVVFVVRPPTGTPTGRYLGCVHLQQLLRLPPADLIGAVLDSDLPWIAPDDSAEHIARFLAAYNLVCAPVVDDERHLLGAITVDDLLDHLLPENWRDEELAHPQEFR